MQLFKELQRRNVFRVALGYIVSSWLLLQVADLVLENIGAPGWVMQTIMLVLGLGFPVVVFFSWAYEVTPEGIKRESEVDRSQSTTPVTRRKLDRAIVLVLAVSLAYLAFDKFVLDPQRDAALVRDLQQAAEESPAAGAAVNGMDDRSIAVLPFVNMSGDPENDYFSDGLTEELLNSLVRLGELKVTGRTSSFAFKNQSTDLREIGRQLDVAHILEGSVRKAGNRVRITAQLVKTSDGYHLWSESFDRELDDIFKIQEEIASQVSRALQVALMGSEIQTAGVSQTRDPAAFEEYLRGMHAWYREPDDAQELDRARGHFERALEIEPEYVEALYGVFIVWSRTNRNGIIPYVESLEAMKSVAERIEALAPGSDLALLAGSRTAFLDYEYATALEMLETAVERYPASSEALARYSGLLSTVGEFEASRKAIDRALEIDPLSLLVMRRKAFGALFEGDCERVERTLDRALELHPDAGRFRGYLAMCLYANGGDLERATALARSEPLLFLRETNLAIFLDAAGDRPQAQAHLEAMIREYGDFAAYQYAQVYAQWGEIEQALTWLEKAVEIRDAGVSLSRMDPFLDPLRGEPRFRGVLEAVGLGNEATD